MKWRNSVWLLCLSSPLVLADPAPVPGSQAAGSPNAAFDDTRYRLGYEVYLARRNLAAAWQVAQKAVTAAPQNLDWVKRYAQVSEWIGEPEKALPAWLKYALATNDNEAWETVGRLARGLLDDESLLLYQLRRLYMSPNSEEDILKTVQIYERLGRPEEGLDFLDRLYGQMGRARGNLNLLTGMDKSNPKRALLAAEAGLAERAGQDDVALNVLNRLISEYQPLEDSWLLRRASILYQRGEVQKAWQSLADHEAEIPADRGEYWRTFAELSRLVDDKKAAARAYQHLIDEFQFNDIALTNYGSLLESTDPLMAAYMSELLYRLYGQKYAVITLLYRYQKANRLDEADRFLAKLSPDELHELERDPQFLEQRARQYWMKEDLVAAQAEYERALKMAPRQIDLLQGLAGVLIGQHKNEQLKSVLLSAEATAKRAPQLWLTWASGWTHLQQPLRALPYYQAYYRNYPNDHFGALSLADALHSAGVVDQSNLLRASLLGKSSAELERVDKGERLDELKRALFALTLDRLPTDASRQQLQQHLAAASGQTGDTTNQDLALGWLFSHEAYDKSRLWLSQHHGKTPAPAWATLSLALQEQDQPALDDLLNKQAATLPVYERIEAALRTDRPALAASMAFDTLVDYPDDDELHHRYSNLASEQGHWLDLTLATGRQGNLNRDQQQLSWATPLNDQWRLAVDLSRQPQDSRDSNLLGDVPGSADSQELRFNYHREQYDWDLALTHGHSLASYTGWRIGQDMRFDSQLSGHWQWQQHQEATESTGLLLGGMKDRLVGGLRWNPTGSDYLSLELGLDRYRGQRGGRLGDGRLATLELGHRLSADHLLKASAGLGRFDAGDRELDARLATLIPEGQTASTGFFVPQDYEQFGLAWAFGDSGERQYQRLWRYFGELGLNYSDLSGTGLNARLGIQGPVLGSDRLSLSAISSKSGQRNGDSTRGITLSYRLFY